MQRIMPANPLLPVGDPGDRLPVAGRQYRTCIFKLHSRLV